MVPSTRRFALALLSSVCLTAAVAVVPATADTTLSLVSFSPLAQVGGEITLRGQITEPDSRAVHIERQTSSAWSQVIDAEPDDDGAFFATFPADRSGTNYFRAVIPAEGDEAEVTSTPVRVSVFGPGDHPFTSAPIPTITGSLEVGSTLRAVPGSWDPKPDGFTYRWNRDGKATGKSGSTYVPTVDDLGGYVTVSVLGWKSGSFTARDSRPTTRVVEGHFQRTTTEIIGRVASDSSLRADVSAWSPKPIDVSYAWLRDGEPIEGSTDSTYPLTANDAGASLSVRVRGSSPGMETAEVTSPVRQLPAWLARPMHTFGDLMRPYSDEVWSSSDVTWSTSLSVPKWSNNVRTRWDFSGAFTHSQQPRPAYTLYKAVNDRDYVSAGKGAEYPGTNVSLKKADVTFTVTARRFAIAFRAARNNDSMVWIDGRPIDDHPIPGRSSSETGAEPNWLEISLPARKTVDVRFAGPNVFIGVDAPRDDNVTVTATPPRFTLGLLSDSFHEVCADSRCNSRTAAPIMTTLSGFRIWNLSESATGFTKASGAKAGEYVPSPYGSDRRFAAVTSAPLDALLINGTVNDVYSSSDTHRTAVDVLLGKLEAAEPDLPVVLVGVEPIPWQQNSWWRGKGKMLTTNLTAASLRHNNVVGFIDPYTDRWITGTGWRGHETGTGNSDQFIGTDSAHLTMTGQAYYQGRIVDALRTLELPDRSAP
jgi:hypothetical protein